MTTCPIPSRPTVINPSRWTVLPFALVPLVLGMVPPALFFTLDPTTATRIGMGVLPIPAWMFTAIWVVAYPGMGVATWRVWRHRSQADVCVPIAIFLVSFVQSLSFWLTNSVHMTAVLDCLGALLALTVGWVYSRYDTRAVWFLLPWMAWMPVTLGIKLWALAHGAV